VAATLAAMANEIRVAADVEDRAKSLKFIGHGDGGPTIMISNAARSRWFGVYNDAGKPVYGEEHTHYDVACDSDEVLQFEGQDAFVLQEEGATAFVKTEDGFLLIRWVGADSEAAILGVSEACSYAPRLRDDAPLHFISAGGMYTLMHATEDGRRLDKAMWEYDEFEIPAGRYGVQQLDVDGGHEWNGTVVFDSRSEDAMVGAYRFVRP
jgi:hypothetical protein